MELATVLVTDGGHSDGAPDIPLPVVPADEHRHKLDAIEPVRLRPSLAPAHFDGSGVDHDVLDSVMCEESVNPEAITAGFITGDDLGVFGKSEARLGLLDLAHDRALATRGNRPDSGWPPRANAESQLPVSPTQLER